MNKETIKKALSKYDAVKVDVYLNYLIHLSTEKKNNELKNKWFQYQKEEALIAIYKKVAIDNLYIDGDTITLTFKGKLMATYDYQAYKNKVLNIYPEAKFDFGLVYNEDKFSFKKESGKVVYTHQIANPFSNQKVIIGAYGIIKTPRGEFIELLNTSDIDKIKSTAKTKSIWDAWFDRMVLKSIIKRICKVAFKDQFRNIEAIDNENYDLSGGVSNSIDKDQEIKDLINNAETEEELNNIYRANKTLVSDEKVFIELLGARKQEILKG